jgi:hypothetical protein
VQSIDTATKAGAEYFGFLMSMIGMVDSYYAYAEEIYSEHVNMQIKIMEMLDRKSEALAMSRKIELEAMDESLWAMQKSVWAMEDAVEAVAEAEKNLRAAFKAETDKLNESLKETQDIISELTGYVNKLKSARESMRLQDAAYEVIRYRTAQAALFELLAQVRGGNFGGIKDIDQTLQTLTQASTEQYTNSVSYKRDFWKTYNSIAEIEDLAGDQLSINETIAEGIQTQIDYLDKQLNAILGLDATVMSVGDAIIAYQAAMAGLQAAQLNAQAMMLAAIREPWSGGGGGGGGSKPPSTGYLGDLPGLPSEDPWSAANPAAFAIIRAQHPLFYWQREHPGETPPGGPYPNLPSPYASPIFMAEGGISSGPQTGYGATLHGIEAVVPLPGGRSIPVEFKSGNNVILIEEVRALRAELKIANYKLVKNSDKMARALDLAENEMKTDGILTRTA